MKKLITILTVAVLAAGAQASVTLNLELTNIQDHEGNLYPDGANNPGQLVVLIGDVGGDGFESLDAIHNNEGFVDDDDVIIDSWKMDVFNSLIVGGDKHSISGYDMVSDGFSEGGGGSLCLVWFEDVLASDHGVVKDDAPGDEATGTPGVDEYYGYHTEWTLPSDGSTEPLTYDVPGTYTMSQTVPEPMTMALLAGGGLFVALRRRKNA